jgi:hypothetical protein
LTSHARELGTGALSGKPKFDRLVVAVAAVAKKAEQQHDEREDRDKYHERLNGGIGVGLGTRNVIKQTN